MTVLGGRTSYPQEPSVKILETFKNPHPLRKYQITFQCPEFTSLCPITSQPDFATIEIRYVPAQKCIESKSLKLYLFSYRQTGAFMEDITNRVLNDLVYICNPRTIAVTGKFRARGGIETTIEVTYVSSK